MAEEVKIGSRLKKTRLAKGISLEEAYHKTKIHISVLNAIEADRLKDFSPTYMKGFLRIYSQYLGLNTKEILEQYEEKYLPEKREVTIPKKEIKPKFNFNFFVPSLKILGKLLVIIFMLLLVARFISFVKSKIPGPSKIKIQISESKKKQPQAQPKEPAAAIEQEATTVSLAIRVKEDSWVQINCDGTKIFEGILKRGMKESWTADEKIRLSVGNAGGLELEVNGELIDPIGRRRQVVRDIVITSEGLSIGEPR